ncbi:unnamed protein product [Pieris brassicae]|uniref:Uncharacterized protein n=1 Tax=Pieris brassicae TaxID=7116 RepID=A0A9P0TG60_PIEBR|nr:unnamed protein product [Pieris brassicae]
MESVRTISREQRAGAGAPLAENCGTRGGRAGKNASPPCDCPPRRITALAHTRHEKSCVEKGLANGRLVKQTNTTDQSSGN